MHKPTTIEDVARDMVIFRSPDERRLWYQTREELVKNAGGNKGKVPIEDILEPRIKLMAAFSLVQEGIFIMSSDKSEALVLTERGTSHFIGIQALSKG